MYGDCMKKTKDDRPAPDSLDMPINWPELSPVAKEIVRRRWPSKMPTNREYLMTEFTDYEHDRLWQEEMMSRDD
jgi:hypothetical protein